MISKIFIATDSSPVDMQSYELCADMIDVVIDISCIYGGDAARAAADDEHDPKPADSHCIITLNNGNALFLREVNRSLALVCILKTRCSTSRASSSTTSSASASRSSSSSACRPPSERRRPREMCVESGRRTRHLSK